MLCKDKQKCGRYLSDFIGYFISYKDEVSKRGMIKGGAKPKGKEAENIVLVNNNSNIAKSKKKCC